ncbi:MAG: hypothetical protein ACP5HS_09490 [Anaerolineae bacterium]
MQEVHVYGNGRGFVIVPVLEETGQEPREILPVERVSLTLGRPTVVELSRALRSAHERSTSGETDDVTPWDGDQGRWWQHNLLFVVIKWEEAHVAFLSQRKSPEGEWESFDARRFPADVQTLELAEALIAYLGERLHA